jgi:hypothetical protein
MIQGKKCLLMLCFVFGAMFSFAQPSGTGGYHVINDFRPVQKALDRPIRMDATRPLLIDPVSVSFSIYVSTRPKKPYTMQISSTAGIVMQAIRNASSTPLVRLWPWGEKANLTGIRNEPAPVTLSEPVARNASLHEALVSGW